MVRTTCSSCTRRAGSGSATRASLPPSAQRNEDQVVGDGCRPMRRLRQATQGAAAHDAIGGGHASATTACGTPWAALVELSDHGRRRLRRRTTLALRGGPDGPTHRTPHARMRDVRAGGVRSVGPRRRIRPRCLRARRGSRDAGCCSSSSRNTRHGRRTSSPAPRIGRAHALEVRPSPGAAAAVARGTPKALRPFESHDAAEADRSGTSRPGRGACARGCGLRRGVRCGDSSCWRRHGGAVLRARTRSGWRSVAHARRPLDR